MSASASHNSSDNGSSKKSRGISGGGRAEGAALALGRIGQASSHVVDRQLREISQNLSLRHASRQVAQDVAYGNTGASNARLTKSDGRIHGDSVEKIHNCSLRQLPSAAKFRLVGPTSY